MGDEALPGSAVDVFDIHAVLDALPRAIIVTDPSGRILMWNSRATELYGWAADEVVGRSAADVLVPVSDREQGAAIRALVRAGSGWDGEFTLRRRDGDAFRAWVSNQPIRDRAGTVIAVIGASEDVTDRRLLEQRADELTDRLRVALRAGGLGTFQWDRRTGVTEWDEELEALFGLEPGTFPGTFDAWLALIHPDDRDRAAAVVEEAVAARAAFTVEHRTIWSDGSTHWIHGAGQVTVDESGEVTGAIGCTRDVTVQVVAEEIRARAVEEALEAAQQERVSRERLEFLSSINDALASSTDRRQVMQRVTRAAVPRLGDWCSIYVLPVNGSPVPEIETAHVDPAMVAYARELHDRFPYDPAATVGMPKVIRTGTPDFYPDIDEVVIDELEMSDDARQIVRNLVLRSSIAVPLVKRGRVLGGIQFVMSASRRKYTEDDLTLIEAVAARIASSLENLRLNEEQRSIAATLQASLLPDVLPEIPGVALAVRYWASGEGVDVGGDFYDVFGIDDGHWAVVIGDVCGTGPAAAAVTGLARHTIASAAWHGDDHIAVLGNLNRTLRARGAGPFCTALYGTAEPTVDGLTFQFASGGHPLPVVVRADGSAQPVGEHGSLLGVFDEIDLTTSTTQLGPGDTLVLYTDGVTDLPPPHALAEDELLALVRGATANTEPVERVADNIHSALAALLPIERRTDDIALLLLRVRPSDN